ncbi:sensor histidine kinase [Paenibacillus hexagrammi]|uniref:histidine kinase n=1 Tax=Paenibacillus hexagrammi TaxID=2908839 RepID=A0ABY3SI95_9BACL|nr:HAMP domain-containing sensor histidine kinase [Paenibacillus sp. YPD9-1]UJF32866.1 HAMP domain-containing histidine kinase [Paenibacillus sp. YPD9-1]
MKRKGRYADLFVPHSLRFQLLSRSLLILSLLLLLIGVFQYIFMQKFLYKNQADTVLSQLRSIPPNTWMHGGQPFFRGVMPKGGGADKTNSSEQPRRNESETEPRDDVPRFFTPDLSVAIIDEDANYKLLSTLHDVISTPQLSAQEYKEIMSSRTIPDPRKMTDSNGNEQLVVFHVVGGPDHTQGIIQASASTKPIKDVLLRQFVTFLSLSMLALVAGLLTFLPILRRTLIPLSNMIDTVKRIDSGNLEERLPVHQGQLEIDRLSASFNSMLERLEISFEAEKEAKEEMRRFLADASHELRTPLTSIHGFLEVLLRGAYTQQEQLLKALKSMHGESERINKLVNDLFQLVRLDRTPAFHTAEARLDEVLHDMEPQLKLLAGERTVHLDLMPGTQATVDTDKIKQVVLNLFHNAVQHTHPTEGRIGIRLVHREGEIELSVEDNGPGISPEHAAHVFDRFYRIDSSRARKYGGAGLGLSITKSIVELHGGTIHVDSKEGTGSTFVVRLPSNVSKDLNP